MIYLILHKNKTGDYLSIRVKEMGKNIRIHRIIATVWLKNKNSKRIIYTDSRTAISWVKKKNCNTKLQRTEKNKVVFELVDRAVAWLKTNTYTTVIVKWETKAWGEIPADFGRK